MSMFRREKPAPVPGAPAGAAEAPARVTQIATGSRVHGEVTGSAEVVVDGEVEGAIRVDSTVVVGAGGLVQGPILARVVRVCGRVVGDVRGSERVEVDQAGIVEGDIAAPRVTIAEGAFFKGMIQMQGDKARDERLPEAPVEPGRSG